MTTVVKRLSQSVVNCLNNWFVCRSTAEDAMRFRGLITDGQQIQSLIKVFQSVAKFWDTFYVKLSEKSIHLISDRSNSLSPFVVKCDLNCDDYFQEYVFRGVSADRNHIYFEMRSDCVQQVMSSLMPIIKSLKLKLTNRSNAHVLAIGVEYPTNDSDRYVSHDIKVEIIKTQYWDQICGLDSGTYDLSFFLPESLTVMSTIERLNELCAFVVLKARVSGDNKTILTITAETDSIALKTKFTDLELNTTDDSSFNDDRHWVSVRVSLT
ncbi:unnamed protein product [Medioppia subpectinata]|uniref:Checkpoint protein n=1 Tax=Medioppia subpectinata TaxID=1979941 RepID=A0A7R9KUP2_9ACAR|nr:unnamed protein product [Medioppia subpectinata]CAG2109799.1 unnamed protein product [Medioppia subpectinata]